MKKENFVTLMLSTIGLLLFALGMCMCLLPQWNMFNYGLAFGLVGAIILLIMVIARRKMLGKEPVKISPKAVFLLIYTIIATLVLGVGMCMVMVWNMMLKGVVIGIIGIFMLIMLVPIIKGVSK